MPLAPRADRAAVVPFRRPARARVRIGRLGAGTLAAALLAAGAGCRPAGPTPAGAAAAGDDAVIYFNAVVLTGDPAHPRAAGLRIEGDRVTHLFDGAPPPALHGRRVDLGGAAVLPGLVDAHLHLRGLGLAHRQLDLKGTRSAEEVAGLVRDAAGRAPAGAWVRGRGWDQNDWPDKRFPAHALLDDAAPDHPVWLTRVDGHAVWVNAAAMRAAGVTSDTVAPAGGEILRDAAGAPTGVFVDNAIDLIEKKLPPPTEAELREDVLAGAALCAKAGLTGVHDMGTTPEVLAVLRALAAEGRLGLRVWVFLDGQRPAAEFEATLRTPLSADVAVSSAAGASRGGAGLVRVVGVKLFADGALGSRGAALIAPYSDRRDTKGLLVTAPADLVARAAAVHAAGFQLAIHAIGDRGVRGALDAIAAAEGDDHTRRHRIEHAQVVAPADVPRFAALGVVASMQPTHATSDMPWAEARLGHVRIHGAYAWRTLTSAGAALALGSDAPVEDENPWSSIYAAVTRMDPAGAPPGGWRPEERLTLAEALAGFTRGAAFAVHAEGALGVLRPGATADLTVVDADPTAVAPAALRGVRTLRTVVAGREVYMAPAR
ncbi:MAG TPA: amidohydrolase [Myxococcota bacterium]|nr:amidohydrolase [Myxococcota bacterium]